MGDSINFDYSPLKPPDYVGDYVNAFNAGQAIGKQTAIKNANALFAQNPQAGVQAMTAIDPVQGQALQGINQTNQKNAASMTEAQAEAGGDLQGAQQAAASVGNTGDVLALADRIKAQGDQATKDAADHADKLAAVQHSILTSYPMPPNADPATQAQVLAQRKHVAVYIATTAGYTPEQVQQVAGGDFSDAGLTASMNSTLALKDQLTLGDKEAAQAETHRHNAAVEGKPQYVETKNADGTTTQTLVNGGQGATGAPGGPVNASPADRDALTRAIVAEAGGESPEGQAAVAHVILTRAKAGYGGAQTISDVVHAPGQFEGMTTARAGISQDSPAYQSAQKVADGVLAGQIPDPTGGADHYLNPELQSQLGRQQPPWATGNGLRIDHQVFYGGQSGGNTAPYQVASNGPTPPPPSGQGASPAPAAAGGVQTPPRGGPPAVIGGSNAQQGADMATGDKSKSGSAYLASLNPTQAAQVKALDEGRLPIPSGFALKSPYWQAMIADASRYDPNFDAVNYPARVKTRSDFTSGKSAQNITALNTALGHMDTLDRAIDPLNNVSIPLVGGAINAMKDQAQDPNTARLANFNAAKTAVAAELTRVFRGGQGAEADVKGWQAQLDASKSPQQLHAVVSQMASLLASRVNALGDQYNQGMGTTRDGLSLLHPTAAAVLARLGGEDGNEAAAKAGFYQNAHLPPQEADAAWTKYQAQHFGAGAKGASRGQSPSSGVRYIGPAQ